MQDSINYASIINQANVGLCLDSLNNYWKEMLKIEGGFLLYDTLNYRDSIKIGAMASACSDYYGDPIHLSRSFMTLLDDVYYDNNDGCRIDNRIRSNPLSDTEEKVLNMNVFPNPIHHETKINFSEKVTGSYYLLDLNGKVIKEGTIENNRDLSLDCSHFNTGTYIFNVVTSTSQLSEKLVIINE